MLYCFDILSDELNKTSLSVNNSPVTFNTSLYIEYFRDKLMCVSHSYGGSLIYACTVTTDHVHLGVRAKEAIEK